MLTAPHPAYFWFEFALWASCEARLFPAFVMCRAVSKMVPNCLSFGDSFDQPGSFPNPCERAIDLPRKKWGRSMAFLRRPGSL